MSEIWIMKESTKLELERMIQPKMEYNPIGIDMSWGAKMIAVPDHYLIRDIAVPGFSKGYIMRNIYPYRSKKKRIRQKWFTRHGVKHL